MESNPNSSNLSSRSQTPSSPSFRCDVCLRLFHSERALSLHCKTIRRCNRPTEQIIITNDESNSGSSNYSSCSQTPSSQSNSSASSLSSRSQTPSSQSNSRSSNLPSHYQTPSSPSFFCEACFRLFHSERALLLHRNCICEYTRPTGLITFTND